MRWLAGALLFVPAAAEAQCRVQTEGSNCVAVPQSQVRERTVFVGDILPHGEYSMLLNAPYYGLPRASGGWVYFRVDEEIVRVNLRTMEVLEIVTDEAGRNIR